MVKQLSCVGFWVVVTFPGDLALSYSKFSKSTLQQGKQSKVVPICGSHWGFTVFNHAFAILVETVNEAHGLEKMPIAIVRKCSQRMRKNRSYLWMVLWTAVYIPGTTIEWHISNNGFRYYTETDNTSVQRKRSNYLMLPCKTYSCAFQQEENYNQYNMWCSHSTHPKFYHSGMNSFLEFLQAIGLQWLVQSLTRWEFDLGIAGLMVLTSASG